MNTNTQLIFALLVCVLGVKNKAVNAEFNFSTIDRNTNHDIIKAGDFAKPGCRSRCGNLQVPYPFGIVSKDGEFTNCSIIGERIPVSSYPYFSVTCNYSTNPPKAFMSFYKHIEIYDISDTELRISNSVAESCYDQSGSVYRNNSASTEVDGTSFTYSRANALTVVGCDDYIDTFEGSTLPKGCGTRCANAEEVDKDGCFGTGCCQASVNLRNFYAMFLRSYNNHRDNISSCGYAFLGEKNKFDTRFLLNLNDPGLKNKIMDTIPIVLDWVVELNKNCSVAAQNSTTFACRHENTSCIDVAKGFGNGYRCRCRQGYEGNPYLSPGCKDVDECADPNKNNCSDKACINLPGGYECACPDDYHGDGRKDGTGCVAESKFPLLKFIIGMSISSISMIIGTTWLYYIIKKRRYARSKERFFEQNGGILLKQQVVSKEGVTVESTKLFTDEELKKATNNYASDRILGQGGYGIVFKGILPDQRVVAIKRSKIIDTSQIEQFINEMVILTQVNHRNVVKLLGCCLECEVPLLVYEFVSNGTLYEHVHNIYGGQSWLSLDNRLRIAAESSGALAYLHSAASIPIIHRDVKLANILLDDHHVAKISDFGASRLVPLDQTQVSTLVQGTLGYLDPEYFQTGQLTDKSDVYSFGVVLAELLTGRKPICMEKSPEDRNLATYFITSLKENRIFQILDPRVIKEGTIEQLETAAQLVTRCLSLNGHERPTMKEVTVILESLRRFTKHPWANNQHGNEETTSLISHVEIEPSDLYEIQLNSSNHFGNDSEHYSSSTISLLHSSNSPR